MRTSTEWDSSDPNCLKLWFCCPLPKCKTQLKLPPDSRPASADVPSTILPSQVGHVWQLLSHQPGRSRQTATVFSHSLCLWDQKINNAHHEFSTAPQIRFCQFKPLWNLGKKLFTGWVSLYSKSSAQLAVHLWLSQANLHMLFHFSQCFSRLRCL